MEWPESSVGNTRMFLEGRESDGLTEDGRDGDFKMVFSDSKCHVERFPL